MSETNDLSNISFILDFKNPNKLPVEAFELMLLLGHRREALHLVKRVEDPEVKSFALKLIALHTRNKTKAKALLLQALEEYGKIRSISFDYRFGEFLDTIKPDDEELVQKIIDDIEAINDDQNKITHAATVAGWLVDAGKLQQAKDLLAKIVEFVKADEKFYYFYSLSGAFRKVNETEKAVEMAEKALAISLNIRDNEHRNDHLYWTGLVFVRLEQWEQVQNIIQLLDNDTDISRLKQSIILQTAMARIIGKKGGQEKLTAIQLLDEAEQRVKACPQDFYKIEPFIDIANTFADIDEKERANTAIKQASNILANRPDREFLGYLADAYIKLGQNEKAIEVINQIVQLVSDLNEKDDVPDIILFLYNPVKLLLKIGQWERAKEVTYLFDYETLYEEEQVEQVGLLSMIGIWLAKQAANTLTEIRDLTA